MSRRLLLALFILPFAACEDINALCASAEGSSSCGQCIKQHPMCGWCRDPHSRVESRCMLKSMLTPDKCNPNYVYSPMTEMRVARADPLRARLREGFEAAIEPQAVELKLKPGDELEVPLKFLHSGESGHSVNRDFSIRTSKLPEGVKMVFTIECHGSTVEGTRCDGVEDGTILNVKAKVSLSECHPQQSGSLGVSVSSHSSGRSICALYVTPQCGCGCEKLEQMEKNSPLCHQHGNLICGQCQCQSGRGGANCECPLAHYGVSTPEELVDMCREKPGAPVCGGNGRCHCGKCACDNPTITGKFCQCNHATCPTGGALNQTCHGHGVCECGQCKCESGWTRDDCSCTTDTRTCMEGNKVCSGSGACQCGKCVCNDGFTGATCNAKEETEDNGESEEPTPTEPVDDKLLTQHISTEQPSEETKPEEPTQPVVDATATEQPVEETPSDEPTNEGTNAPDAQPETASASTSTFSVLTMVALALGNVFA